MPGETTIDDQQIGLIEDDTPSSSSSPSEAPNSAPFLAKELHESGLVYSVYAFFDAINLVSGNNKAWLELWLQFQHSSQSSADLMHDVMLTPEGLALTAAEAALLVTSSLIANYTGNTEKNWFKKGMANAHPYVRDFIKALKNGNKGGLNFSKMLHSLVFIDVKVVAFPLILSLCSISIINRMWIRYMVEARKKLMDANKKILKEIQEADTLTWEQCDELRLRMENAQQSIGVRKAAYASAALSGMVDYPYLYLGVFGLVTVGWPLLITMTAFCAAYSLSCIITRVYEEWVYQNQLFALQAKAALHMYVKEEGLTIQLDFARLHALSILLAAEPPSDIRQALLEEQAFLAKALHESILLFNTKRERWQSLESLTLSTAFFAGLRNGLGAYGAVMSCLMSVGTILSLMSVAFPPVLILTCVIGGMGLLIGFIAHSMIQHYMHSQTIIPHQGERLLDLLETMQAIECFPEGFATVEDTVKTILNDSLTLKYKPSFRYAEFCEVIRSLFSGLSKGPKFVDFILNFLEKLDEQQHYTESLPMFFLAALFALLHAIIWALRAYARGFGRDDEPLISAPSSSATEDSTSSNSPRAQLALATSEVVEKEEEAAFTKQEEGLQNTALTTTELKLSQMPSLFLTQSQPDSDFSESSSEAEESKKKAWAGQNVSCQPQPSRPGSGLANFPSEFEGDAAKNVKPISCTSPRSSGSRSISPEVPGLKEQANRREQVEPSCARTTSSFFYRTQPISSVTPPISASPAIAAC